MKGVLPTPVLHDRSAHCAGQGQTQAYTSQRKLTTAMEERGFRQKRTNSSRQLEGITVCDII